MGRRREPRKEIEVQVRIFGTSSSGQTFSDKAVTVNVSHQGVELSGVQPQLKIDEIIGLTYGTNRVHFRIKWIGEAGTPKAGHVGLLNTSPEKPLWDFPLPPPAADNHQAKFAETRKHPRFKCQNSVEIHAQAGASFWAKIADLSVGGCYIEMAIPLPKGTKVRVGIWIDDAKSWADGEVTYSTPGFGTGVKFTKVSDLDHERIEQYLSTLTRFIKKPAFEKKL
jgi:hypothetical protein